MLRRLLPYAKWIWVIFLVVVVIYYIQGNFQAVFTELQTIEVWRMLLSVFTLFLGRLLIVQLAQQSLYVNGYDFSYTQLFRMVGLSELAKYLPSGIWHFVGRAAYYYKSNVSFIDGSRALLLEHLWLIISSALVGGIFFLWFDGALQSLLTSVLLMIIGLGLLALLAKQYRNSVGAKHPVLLFILQIFIWISLGSSYSVLMPVNNISGLFLIQGAFAISWLIGFLAVIAPGGLGIREVIIATLMLPLFPASTTLTLAMVHRLLWVFVELLMGAIALFLHRNGRNNTLLQ